MTRLRAIYPLAVCCLALVCSAQAQQKPDWDIKSLTGEGSVIYDFDTGIARATNGVMVRYGEAVLTANDVMVNQVTGEVVADGRVRIQQGDQVWVSEHMLYNFNTREIQSQQFRTGKAPLYASGEGLHADLSNRVYTATNALITTEDIYRPFVKVRASRIRIIPGERVTAEDAVVYVGKVPIFYFPYYSRKIGPRANHWNVTPGYRSSYGAYALGSYTFFLNEQLDGVAHVDYRVKRGIALGPDLNYDYDKWGHGTFRYYYAHDLAPNESTPDVDIPKDRQRVWFSYSAMPATNLQALSVVRYQTDMAVARDFFEGEYRQNPQPNTFLELNKFWSNFSVDLYTEPRVNDFLETVERLPEVRLTGYRQQIGDTPFYYESQSSVGYYQRKFAEDTGVYGPPPGLNYSASRADTFHQITLPYSFFGWLNTIPRVGGRYTYYTEASGPGGWTEEQSRGVFNTGVEVNVKASRVWPGVSSSTFDLDGLRHIFVPAVNYGFVPSPNVAPPQLPQFDYLSPSLRMLPIEFPDFNDIDDIDSQNVLRLGIRNRLQTKRRGQVAPDVVSWDLYTDYRLDKEYTEETFSDVFSDLILRPRSWLTLESLIRVDPYSGQFNMALHSFRIQPNHIWSWGLTHFYLRDNLGAEYGTTTEGNNSIATTFFYRFNENWGFRTSQYFNVETGNLQEQFYTLYRDLRSWTAALTFSVRDNLGGPYEYSVAFTFSLKAFPRFSLGADSVNPYTLLGS